VVLVSDRVLDDDPERLEEVFVVIDGLQVPFPVEDLTLLTDTSAHLQLEFVGSQDEALGLVGCEVFAEGAPHEEPETEAGPEQWIGFTVHDTGGYGKIGVLQEIEDYNGNIVLQVMDGDKETLLSLYPELVTSVDNHAKILYIGAPDGYFDNTDDE
jgi:ribosomal 30S subunit maturation factor RimM